MLSEAIRTLLGLGGPKPLEPNTDRIVLVADDHGIRDLEEYADRPARIREVVSLTGIKTFTSYVNRYKDAATTIFVNPSLASLAKGAQFATAVIDYHQNAEEGPNDPPSGNEARWGSHRATLLASPSLAYAKLLELDGKLLDQAEFARQMEEIARFSTSHAAADLIEVARTLNLTSKGAFKTFDDDFSGSVSLVYDVQVKADAGSAERRLAVPATIAFGVALIDGMPEEPVEVKFLYRIPADVGGKVQMGIRIIDRPWLEKAAIDAVAAHLAEATDCAVYVGTQSK